MAYSFMFKNAKKCTYSSWNISAHFLLYLFWNILTDLSWNCSALLFWHLIAHLTWNFDTFLLGNCDSDWTAHLENIHAYI